MADSSRGYQQLFAELKRRHVFKVAAIYGAVAFGVLQVAEPLGAALGLSDSFLSLVVGLLLVGFPVALVLAWAFEVTPEGVQKAEAATPEEIEAIVAEPASKRWPSGLLALAGVALLFGGWWMGRRGAEPELNLSVPGAEAAGLHKIAVLPFDDLGGNEENDPLIRGFHIEIIDKLSTLGDLRVTQPASVFSYASSTKDAREIATELADVDYLVRGSVVRSGTQARINVFLVDLATNEPVPIENWTGEVTVDSVISIQARIARRVADKLEARLSPQDIEQLETGLSTKDPAAINAYYRAREVWASPSADKGDDDELDALERAVALDPGFVEAWAFMARVASQSSQISPEYSDPAFEAVQRTETLAPRSLEAIKARGWYTYYVERDFRRALELMRRAERLAPSDSDVLSTIGFLQHRLGEFEAGNRTIKQAVDLDPQNAERLVELADALGRVTKWEAAHDVVERVLAIDPSNARAQLYEMHLVLRRDRDPSAARSLAVERGFDPTNWGGLLSRFALVERDYDGAAQILAASLQDETKPIVRRERVGRLVTAVFVAQQRGRDPAPLLDSLRVVLGPDSTVAADYQVFQAAARVLTGDEQAGMGLLTGVVEGARSSDDQVAQIDILWSAARTYAWFGKLEEALALLDEAVAKPTTEWWSAADLLLDPRFDALRDDPRFDDLVGRQEAYEAAQAREAEGEDWLP